eukprot:scaffold26504_cov44-Prasinocladus_malaysianus.AAC.2
MMWLATRYHCAHAIRCTIANGVEKQSDLHRSVSGQPMLSRENIIIAIGCSSRGKKLEWNTTEAVFGLEWHEAAGTKPKVNPSNRPHRHACQCHNIPYIMHADVWQ